MPISILSIAAAAILAVIGLTWMQSSTGGPPAAARNEKASDSPDKRRAAVKVEYEVVNSYPHDPNAFLQGLVWHNGYFYESTGLEGQSTLRQVEFPSGKVVKMTRLAPQYFGEGLALVGDKLVQLTWTTGKGFVYDRESFQKIGEFSYTNEGWGLTYDGSHLIMSDGSNVLTYLDPQSYKPVKKLPVTMNGNPVMNLNELEFINGEVWANVWQSDMILRIDPATGQVTSYLDLSRILPASQRRGGEDVLNGIAYDPAQKRIFVSGKLWPKLFEIRLK